MKRNVERLLATIAVLLAALVSSTPVRVRDGPLIRPPTEQALPTVTPTGTGIPATPSQTPRPTATTRPTPTPTTWPMSPAVLALGEDAVDLYRIWNAWKCGGSAHDCMMQESDAMVLTRIAIAEAPSSINDQVLVMWLIRLRAELGYKNRRLTGGWCGDQKCYVPGRWGEPTTIKTEALCVDGCQFSPASYAQHVYFACQIDPTIHMRMALCPTDDQLGTFDLAYHAAQDMLAAPLTDFPIALRGYDGFRSPSIAGEGQRNRVDGLKSQRLWPGGNIWRDELLDDNLFWRQLQEETSGAILRPTQEGG